MEIFWRLVLAHLLADFTLQTDFIARWKRENVFGAAAHALVFFACGAALCFGSLGRVWLAPADGIAFGGWAVLAGLTALHFIQDEWRTWTIRRLNSPDSLFFFLEDQFVHLVLIFVLFPGWGAGYPETWVLFGMVFVLTTHFTSIFVYFLEKDISGYARFESSEQYYSMAEHFAMGLALLLPGFWALAFLGVWGVQIVIARLRHDTETSWLSALAGNGMAVLFGLIARGIYYR